jgi:hypothetical protein
MQGRWIALQLLPKRDRKAGDCFFTRQLNNEFDRSSFAGSTIRTRVRPPPWFRLGARRRSPYVLWYSRGAVCISYQQGVDGHCALMSHCYYFDNEYD